jgi:hypothetical protein
MRTREASDVHLRSALAAARQADIERACRYAHHRPLRWPLTRRLRDALRR